MTYIEYLEKILNFSPKTIEIYTKYANQLKTYKLDYKRMLISLNDISINTKRLIISAIKSYYKFIGDERYKELLLPKKTLIAKDFVSFEEYKLYLKKINRNTKMGFQKRIILRLLFETGLRASELLDLKRAMIQDNRIKINGKGRRERFVFISEWLKEELYEYLEKIENKLFSFGYKNLYNKINMLDRDKKLSPHMFRRGYAKYCFKKGISIYDISLSMGHSSIETTVNYINKDSNDIEIYKIF
ncbi:MAG: site-specific integrase [Mycoplasma sp.]|nr:site-specific integrase [Mycoplasma sp.]